MQYRSFGRNGPLVSTLGFGVMRLPPRKKGDWDTVNFTKATPILRAALDAGVNFFDSHHNYHNGLSEVAIGRALRGYKLAPGRQIVIQSKTPFYNDEPMDYFKRLLEQSLKKTGADCLDYLLFHSMRMRTFKKRGRQFLKFTDWAIKHGLIRHRGFSSHDTPENVQAFIDTGEFSAMVVSYNWLNPKMADTIAYAADAGLGVAVMNPVHGGQLATQTSQIMGLLPGAKTPPEIALRFVLSTPGVTLALSGMNSLAQVAENAAVASLRTPLSAPRRQAMLKRLDRLANEAFVCTACGYCMPCPHGVDIPANFLRLSQAAGFGLVDFAKEQFSRLKKDKAGDKSARACRQCGACLPKCPNDVQIIAQLARAAELLDGEPARR